MEIAETIGEIPGGSLGGNSLMRIDSGADITKVDRLFAPIETSPPLEEADLQRHASKRVPRIAKSMRNWTTGPSEARSHAPARVRREIDQDQINSKMRRGKARLRQMSRTTIGFSLEDFEDALSV